MDFGDLVVGVFQWDFNFVWHGFPCFPNLPIFHYLPIFH